MDAQVRSGDLPFDVIVLPSMTENAIANGRDQPKIILTNTGRYRRRGVENLKKFVERGGKLDLLGRLVRRGH